jgi:hypothetical protein
MELRYIASRSDVRALLFHNLRHGRRLQVVLLSSAAIPIVLGALNLSAKHILSAGNLVPFLIIGIVAAALLPVLAIARTKSDERWLKIDSHGLVTTVGSMRGEIPWNQVDYVADDGARVLITGKNMNGFVIPNSAFASAVDRQVLIASMTAWIASA